MFNNFLSTLMDSNSSIDVAPLEQFILGQITPIFGIISFVVVLGIVFYIGGFWMKYAFADEEKKEELMEKWKKQWMQLLIAGIICASLGTLLMTIGKVFGIDINLNN